MRQETYQAPRRISITGPESTGKSELAAFLARHYGGIAVPEMARLILEKGQFRPPYPQALVEHIALAQWGLEDYLAEQQPKGFLFCDSDLTVLKIWMEEAYGLCPPWLQAAWQAQPYALYLLCDVDCPWTADPLREHPQAHERQYLFQRYVETLAKLPGARVERLSGSWAARQAKALHVLGNL